MIVQVTDKAEWYRYFEKVLLKNISQDWNYGNVKAEIKNVSICRYKVMDADSVIAIFQIYNRMEKYIPFIKISYLNRGPLFMDKPSGDTISKVFREIKQYFKWHKGNLLLLNPFVENSQANLEILRKLKYRRLGQREYTTSYVDLSVSENDLRKKLNAKWRNQLSLAEKKGVTVKVNQSGDNIEDLIRKYNSMMSEKKFSGLLEAEIRLLHKHFSKTSKFINLFAFSEENKMIAFSIVLGYADQAVYLIGWVDNNSRNLNPSNLLLWNAIKYLKENQYSSFDLGGMDEKNLPGIAKFKKGISGNLVTYTERWVNF